MEFLKRLFLVRPQLDLLIANLDVPTLAGFLVEWLASQH
jgi:hypothetical protein